MDLITYLCAVLLITKYIILLKLLIMNEKGLFRQLFLAALFCVPFALNAQVTIGASTVPNATLEIVADVVSPTTPAGVIPPRVDRQFLNGNEGIYGSAQTGAIVYVYSLNGGAISQSVNVSSVGFYYFDGSLWQPLGSGSAAANISEAIWLPSFNLPWGVWTENDQASQMETVNLFQVYQEAFAGLNVDTDGTAVDANDAVNTDGTSRPEGRKTFATFSSKGAPVITLGHQGTVPTDFYYLITSYDPNVIEVISLTEYGVLTYRKLVSTPPFNSFVKILMARRQASN